MTARSLTPAKLRLLLWIVLILILALNAGVFYLGHRYLGNMAGEVGKKVAGANDSRNTIQELQTLKQDLEDNQDVMNKTALIAADAQNYNYQDQIVSDLTTYASRAGVTISNITFSNGGASTGASAPASASPAPAAAEPTTTSLKKTTVSVTLKNPADYKSLLNFLHYVEQNLTRLKVANVTLTKSDGGAVNTDVLNLEVHLR